MQDIVAVVASLVSCPASPLVGYQVLGLAQGCPWTWEQANTLPRKGDEAPVPL